MAGAVVPPFIIGKRRRADYDDMQDDTDEEQLRAGASAGGMMHKRPMLEAQQDSGRSEGPSGKATPLDDAGRFDCTSASEEASAVQAGMLRLMLHTPHNGQPSPLPPPGFPPPFLHAPGAALPVHAPHWRPPHAFPSAHSGEVGPTPLFHRWVVSVKVLVPHAAAVAHAKGALLLAWLLLDEATGYALAIGLHAWAQVQQGSDEQVLQAVVRHAVQVGVASAATLPLPTAGGGASNTGAQAGGHRWAPQPREVLLGDTTSCRMLWWKLRLQFASSLQLVTNPGAHPPPSLLPPGHGQGQGQGGGAPPSAAAADYRWACGRDEEIALGSRKPLPPLGSGGGSGSTYRGGGGSMMSEGGTGEAEGQDMGGGIAAAPRGAAGPADGAVEDPFPLPPGIAFPSPFTSGGAPMGLGAATLLQGQPVAQGLQYAGAGGGVTLPARALSSLCDAWNVSATAPSTVTRMGVGVGGAAAMGMAMGVGAGGSPATRLQALLASAAQHGR